MGVRPLYNRVATKNYSKAVLAIDEMPRKLDISVVKVIQNKISETFPDTKVLFNIKANKSELNRSYTTRDFETQMSMSDREYNEYKRLYEEFTDNTSKRFGKKLRLGPSTLDLNEKTLKERKYKLDSFNFIFDSKSRNNTFVETYFTIEIISPTHKELGRAVDNARALLSTMGFKVRKLNGKYDAYLRSHAPTGLYDKKKSPVVQTLMDVPGFSYLMPTENGGILTNGKGVVMGYDKEKFCPFVLDFTGNTSKQVILVMADSDSGKTTLCKTICLGFIDQGHHASVIDVKKGEWSQLFSIQPGVELDFSDFGNCFVNTFRLDDIPDYVGMTIEIAKNLYISALEVSVEQIMIACGITSDNGQVYSDYMSIAKNAVTKYFKVKRVDADNLRTYYNTSDMSFKGLIEILSDIKDIQSNRKNNEIVEDIIAKVTSVLVNSNLLKGREVSIVDVINAPLVVYDIGLSGGASVNPINSAIRTSMITFLDSKKIFIRKCYGMHTVCFYEEVQTKNNFSSLIPYINRVVTIGRSSNVTVFLLGNSTTILTDGDLKNTVDNISTYIIGPFNDNALSDLRGTPAERLAPLVKKISNNKTKYFKSFACYFDTGQYRDSCIFSAMVTDRLKEVCKSKDEK